MVCGVSVGVFVSVVVLDDDFANGSIDVAFAFGD